MINTLINSKQMKSLLTKISQNSEAAASQPGWT